MRLYSDFNDRIKEFKATHIPTQLSFGFTPDYILEHQDLFRDKVVIDFGCGYGLSTELLSSYAKFVHGIDCSNACIAFARGEYSQVLNMEFTLVDKLTLPFETETIDAAYSNDVLEHVHVDDAVTHLKEVHRVLRTGGTYLLYTPGIGTGPHDMTKAFWPGGHGFKAIGAHIKEYSFSEVADLLLGLGFRNAIIPEPKREVLILARK